MGCDVLKFEILLTGARGVNFLLFALPLMGSFFYWLYAVGYKLFNDYPHLSDNAPKGQ